MFLDVKILFVIYIYTKILHAYDIELTAVYVPAEL